MARLVLRSLQLHHQQPHPLQGIRACDRPRWISLGDLEPSFDSRRGPVSTLSSFGPRNQREMQRGLDKTGPRPLVLRERMTKPGAFFGITDLLIDFPMGEEPGVMTLQQKGGGGAAQNRDIVPLSRDMETP